MSNFKKVVLSLIGLYLGMLLFWLFMMAGCFDYARTAEFEVNCADNELTKVMKVTHWPLVQIILE